MDENIGYEGRTFTANPELTRIINMTQVIKNHIDNCNCNSGGSTITLPKPNASITMLDEDAEATVTVSGTASNPSFDFGIPAGKTGKDGVAGTDGKDGQNGENGADGKSAYQIAIDNGYTGTEVEWLESLKGADGNDGAAGTVGPQGEAGITPHIGVNGNWFIGDTDTNIAASVKGDTGDSGPAGNDGKSAYQLAQEAGFEGSQEEWLESLKGVKGDVGENGQDGAAGADGQDGKSAYQSAIDNGFEGTEAEWLESLKATGSFNAGKGINFTENEDGTKNINVTTPIQPLTQEEYEALGDATQSDGVVYLITDSTGGGTINAASIQSDNTDNVNGIITEELDSDDGYWHIIKYSTGYIDMLFRGPVTVSNWETVLTFKKCVIDPIDLPVNLSTRYNTVISSEVLVNTPIVANIISDSNINLTTTGSIMLVDLFSSITDTTVYINIHVTGRYNVE